MSLAETYVRTLLLPRLRAYKVEKRQRMLVCDDVQQRLSALLSRWSDEPFRRTVLMPAIELATFWRPLDAPLEVRALVAMAVRNSLVEELNFATGRRDQVIPDLEMPALTAEAIGFFADATLRAPHEAPKMDPFAPLPHKYPLAWQAFSTLAHSTEQEATYSMGASETDTAQQAGTRRQEQGVTVVVSGIDPRIDAQLAEVLQQIRQREAGAFASASFSRITRHPDKLMQIVNHVLRNDAYVVTPNYVLAPGYAARRAPLLPPAHDIDEADAAMANVVGLTDRHRRMLGHPA